MKRRGEGGSTLVGIRDKDRCFISPTHQQNIPYRQGARVNGLVVVSQGPMPLPELEWGKGCSHADRQNQIDLVTVVDDSWREQIKQKQQSFRPRITQTSLTVLR